MIAHLIRIHTRIVPQLPRLFDQFPKARFEIRLTDPALAASMPAQWYPPSDDGTRPGIVAMPVVNPRTVSIFGVDLRPRSPARARRHARPPFRRRHQTGKRHCGFPPQVLDECGSSPEGATVEVLRYMAWPGQALGYKIGELTILDICAKAEQWLGAGFDIRAFHDAFLAEGRLPLSLVRARMEAWVEAQVKQP